MDNIKYYFKILFKVFLLVCGFISIVCLMPQALSIANDIEPETTIFNADGKFNTAFSFDGLTNYMEVPFSQSLNITDAITIETWVKAKSQQTYDSPRIISRGQNQSYELAIEKNGKPVFSLWNGSTNYVAEADVNMFDDKWHHITGTWNGTQMLIFFDSVKCVGDLFTGKIATSTTNLSIGAKPTGDQLFNGLIDEVAVYNRSLSPKEIIDHYKRGNITNITIRFILNLIETIPKSMAKSIDEVNFIKILPTQILQRDPIVKFYFEKVEKGEKKEIKYTINKKITKLTSRTIAFYEKSKEIKEVEEEKPEIEEEKEIPEEEKIEKPIPTKRGIIVRVLVIAMTILLIVALYFIGKKKKIKAKKKKLLLKKKEERKKRRKQRIKKIKKFLHKYFGLFKTKEEREEEEKRREEKQREKRKREERERRKRLKLAKKRTLARRKALMAAKAKVYRFFHNIVLKIKAKMEERAERRRRRRAAAALRARARALRKEKERERKKARAERKRRRKAVAALRARTRELRKEKERERKKACAERKRRRKAVAALRTRTRELRKEKESI